MIALAVLAELALYAAAARWLEQAHDVPLWTSGALALAVFLGLRAGLLYLRAGVARWWRPLGREFGALTDLYFVGQLVQRWLAPRDPVRAAPGVVPSAKTCRGNGGVNVDPGTDIATHLNIVTSAPPGM